MGVGRGRWKPFCECTAPLRKMAIIDRSRALGEYQPKYLDDRDGSNYVDKNHNNEGREKVGKLDDNENDDFDCESSDFRLQCKQYLLRRKRL